MMDTNTAILGLLIGAFFGAGGTYAALRGKLAELADRGRERRLSMLEDVAGHIGSVSHTFSKYTSLLAEIGPNKERISPKQQQELDDLSTQLVEVYEQVSIAESKLLLLGETTLQRALKLYSSKMAQFRKLYYPGRYTEQEQANLAHKELSELRTQFYNLLSERYDTLL